MGGLVVTDGKNDEEIGYFKISGGGFGTGETMSMNIEIDEMHQHKGYARFMIKTLCKFIRIEHSSIKNSQKHSYFNNFHILDF